DPHRVEVVNPGVAQFATPQGERNTCRQRIRAEFGVRPSVPLILFVSMNFDVKGLDRVIAGLGELRRQRPDADFSLLVVGKGDQRAYSKLAAAAGIAEDVFFAAEIPRERMPEVYAAGDLFVMLSKFDTFGLVVLEAMAASLPVVISGNVGAKDVVQEGVNGFVITDTTDAGGIAAKISLLLDASIRAKMGEEALRTARENTWDAVADKVIQVYEEIIQNPVKAKIPRT
ncbi:MAG: glycosyltransferase family 4 protein, partial [Syntrophales bacterium LBB04]|nr:glycosyltransferase family 4 protein [Syntrophales bacterium LBB04]